MASNIQPDMPPVTDAHRRRAFADLRLTGTTFEQAMQDDTRRRVIEARAAQLRKREWQTRNIRNKPNA